MTDKAIRPAADRVVVRVPASTANLGPGFDSLGMALSLYAWVDLAPADRTTVTLYGGNLEGVPRDKSNLIYEVAQSVFERAGVRLPELAIGIRSDIPLTRGLGSSASAIVGALVAANALIGEPLETDELFQMATALERHPDNVGASIYGGIVAAAWDGARAEAVRFDPPASLRFLAAIPAFELATKSARGVLPQQVAREDAVFNVAHSSLLTAALATGRLDALRHALRDKLHQPYRAPLIPGMERVLREAPDHGALGAVLSGAGPTLLAFAEAGADIAGLEAFVREALAEAGVQAELRWLQPDLCGPKVRLLVAGESDFGSDPNVVLSSLEGTEVRL
ncbi:homoserine kinase [Cohnella sp. JJ-181]|uniref:homoserine kinase n=1 Tax=Cohnella rhizoplanae TaxID=2974897 RepID=UPI0022FFA850|nr:homoserine kinase [Cohnella sp. JJ-181]CAI6082400.1 Homoserine kinase [Cohnella sp. JJ-181]